MKKLFPWLAVFIVLVICPFALAAIQIFTMEYTYFANELDSRNSCKAIATEQLKRELLEQLGTYVESKTVVRDQEVDKESITTLSAGVVQVIPLQEKWDGKQYWLKAQLKADPDEVAASIKKLKNDEQLANELEESRAQAAHAIEELTALKRQLALATADQEKQEQYNEAVNRLSASDSFDRGTAFAVAGNDEEAVKAYDQAIRFYPDDGKYYINRSAVLVRMGQYDRAAHDLQRASALIPAKENVYYQRIAAQRSTRELRVSSVGKRDNVPRPPPRGDALSRLFQKKRDEQQPPGPKTYSIQGGTLQGHGLKTGAPDYNRPASSRPGGPSGQVHQPGTPGGHRMHGRHTDRGRPAGTAGGSKGEYRARPAVAPTQKIAQPRQDQRPQQKAQQTQKSTRQAGRISKEPTK